MFHFLARLLLLCSPVLVLAQEESIPLKDLHSHPLAGDVFNIEGGKPTRYLTPSQIWSNFAIVLDRPLINGVTLAELTNDNITYPLKESTIPQYNEAQVNLAYLSILSYYIDYAHDITKIDSETPVSIVFHVHRNSSAIPHIGLLQKLLSQAYGEQLTSVADPSHEFTSFYFDNKKVMAHFKRGYQIADFKDYHNYHIVVSISLVGGLNPTISSGSVVIPEKFVPMDIDSYEVFAKKSYQVSNHFFAISQNIIDQPNHSQWVKIINEKFRSQNPLKQEQEAQALKSKDFIPVRLLEIESNFNPKDGHQPVKIYS